jgi:L-aspartate oxidase
VYLTLEHLPADFVRRRFPYLSAMCRRAGFDLARDRLPVGPAAHYLMGGVVSDLEGRTTIPAMFAAGEVACTGVHGANRLASNSLLEGLVFGARAAGAMRRWHSGQTSWPTADRRTRGWGAFSSSQVGSSADEKDARPLVLPSAIELSESDIRALMWRDVGLFRDKTGLDRALARLEPAWQTVGDRAGAPDARTARLASLVTVGRLIAHAARRREESRGAHFRSDFPLRNDIDWKRHVAQTRNEDAR